MTKADDPLEFLLDLNQAVVSAEDAGKPVVALGLPSIVKDKAKFVTDDFIRMPVATKPKAVAGAKGGAG